MKGAAAVVVGSKPEAAFVPFDDRPADGQAHAHAVGLGREERLEDFCRGVGAHAGAAVADEDLDLVLVAATGAEAQDALVVGAGRPSLRCRCERD